MEKRLLLDLSRCVGCGACVVACMDQNDIYPEKGQPAYRRIYQMEEGGQHDAGIQYISAGCMHCEESPCVTGCPTGAIRRDPRGGGVAVIRDRCIGCHSCALACPFGVPRYDREDKLCKCDLCPERVAAGLRPACVKVCPVNALKYESVNDTMAEKERGYLGGVVRAASGANE